MAKIENDLNGWLVIDKPYGMGSTNVVSKLKWLMHPKKIGHAGTLDPLATGVLPIAFGKATKTIPFVMDGKKTYQFIVKWGVETSTDDTEGEVVASDEKRPTLDEIRAILGEFIGDVTQVPPMYSAIKVNGVRAYDLARKGEGVEMKPRGVRIESLRIIQENGLECSDIETCQHTPLTGQEETMFEVVCGKGTYVRSIGHDMGRKLGCYGHITMLRRTVCGPFALNESILLANMEKNDYNTNALSLKPMTTVLSDISVLAVNEGQAQLLIQGRSLRADTFGTKINEKDSSQAIFGFTYLNQLIALARLENGDLKPFRVLADKL